MSDRENGLTVSSSSKPELDDETFEKITTEQQRYCQLVVLTNMTEEDICEQLGVSKKKISMWKKDKYVIRFLAFLKKKYSLESINKSVEQNEFIRNRLFNEFMSRLDDVSEEELEGLSVSERLLVMKTKLKYLSAKELLDVIDSANRRRVIDSEGININEENDEDFVVKIRNIHFKKEQERKRLQEAQVEANIQGSNFIEMVESAAGVFEAEEDNNTDFGESKEKQLSLEDLSI